MKQHWHRAYVTKAQELYRKALSQKASSALGIIASNDYKPAMKLMNEKCKLIHNSSIRQIIEITRNVKNIF